MGWQGKKGTGIFIKLMTGHSGERKLSTFHPFPRGGRTVLLSFEIHKLLSLFLSFNS